MRSVLVEALPRRYSIAQILSIIPGAPRAAYAEEEHCDESENEYPCPVMCEPFHDESFNTRFQLCRAMIRAHGTCTAERTAYCRLEYSEALLTRR